MHIYNNGTILEIKFKSLAVMVFQFFIITRGKQVIKQRVGLLLGAHELLCEIDAIKTYLI